MKQILLLFCLLSFSAHVNAQCNGPFNAADKHTVDDIEISHTSDMAFYSFSEQESGFVLSGSFDNVPIIYQGAMWMGGLTENGQLKVAAKQYEDFSDYVPGVLDDNTGGISNAECSQWERFFKATKEEVENHIADYEDDGMINNTVPDNILYYPAMGNEYFGDKFGWDLPEENIGGLASFVDRNENGLYEPYGGDYPHFRGSEAMYFVGNDLSNNNVNQIGMEFQVTSSVNLDEVDLAFSSQMDIKAIYHGEETLHDFYFGFWNDADLGCLTNDKVGSIPDSNLIFYYGPEVGTCSEGPTFEDGIEPLLIFKYDVEGAGKMSSFVSFNRELVGGPPNATTDPDTHADIYRTLTGQWRDGTPLTYGNEGYNPGSTDVYPYQYDHVGDDAHDPWLACNSPDILRDKRTLVNFGPFTLEPGQIVDIKFSVHFVGDFGNGCPSAEEIMEVCDRINEVILDVEPTEIKRKGNLNIFPNPSGAGFNITSEVDFDRVIISSMTGQLLSEKSMISGKEMYFSQFDHTAGVYYVQIFKGDTMIAVEKMVRY